MGVLVLGVVGCAHSPDVEAIKVPPPAARALVDTPTPPAKPTKLTVEAEGVLKAAEQSVIEARVQRALWSAATVQLQLARRAAEEFDSTATLKHAKEVIALCNLSAEQKSAAVVGW